MKINGATSDKLTKEEKMKEVHRKLQEKENQKARELLAIAMGHYNAMKHMKKQIEDEITYNESNTKP